MNDLLTFFPDISPTFFLHVRSGDSVGGSQSIPRMTKVRYKLAGGEDQTISLHEGHSFFVDQTTIRPPTLWQV